MPFLQSITSFFGGQQHSATSSQNRRTAMNSTFDAFNLPTTSRYDRGGLGVNATDSASSSPGPSRRGSASYAYPPSGDSYQPSTNIYPPLSHTFHRLRNALVDTFPELMETLNSPVDPQLLASFEQELGCPLPPSVRDSLLVSDGQDLDSGSAGIFFGLHLLPLEDVMREWAFWRQAEHDPAAGKNPAVLATMASIPPTWIKQLYACRGWLPLLSDRTGNYIGVDLDPGPGGAWGQVIIFGRDFDRKCVIWRGEGEGGWGKWLASFVDELESGEGWEADKSSSSDEDEDVGYGSYNGGAQYGESGKGLRLAGEYKGWNVLEAWWDRSVKQWERLGLGMDVDEIERGLSEARRLAGLNDKDETEANPRHGDRAVQVEIPVFGSPQIPQAPSTPVPHDSDALLPPASPDHSVGQPRFKPAKIPVRIITPIATTSDHPLQAGSSTERDVSSGLLSPPDRRRSKMPPPAPVPLDLPTRVDMQAMSAIATAEASGLRGGWVMNMDPGIQARMPYREGEAEMVDIDLEGGKGEKFGSPRMSIEESERRREEERTAFANADQRHSPSPYASRTPSPLALGASLEIPIVTTDHTPRAPSRSSTHGEIPPSVLAATNALRRPPPIAAHSDTTLRGRGGTPDDDRDQEVHRFQRESSVISIDSRDGLLEVGSNASRPTSPIFGNSPITSPTTVTARSSTDRRRNGEVESLEEDMQEISLEGESMDLGRKVPV